MSTANQQVPASNKALWAGRIVSGLVAAFLLFDSAIHLTKIAPVVQAFNELGFPIRLAATLGVLELICVLVYIYPRTCVVGAILLTGYLGGAVAMQLRVGNPLFGETLFPLYVGILAWGGIYLREPRLWRLLPVMRSTAERREDSSLRLPRQVSIVQS